MSGQILSSHGLHILEQPQQILLDLSQTFGPYTLFRDGEIAYKMHRKHKQIGYFNSQNIAIQQELLISTFNGKVCE